MFRSQSANRIDELYYKGMRLRRDAAARIGTKSGARGAVRGGRLGDEVTSQTQAIYTDDFFGQITKCRGTLLENSQT